MVKKRPLNSDELGGKGEAKFCELCLDAKLKPNKSDRDRVGWDYVVTWPLVSGVPLDTRPAPTVCHVQLKTIWAGNEAITLNLGTLENIVKDSRPAFIVVFEVDDPSLSIIGIRLIHITVDFLGEILKRLRQAQLKGKQASGVTFQANATKWGAKLDEVSGAAFRRAVDESVSAGMIAYAREKEKQLSEIGYEKGRFSLTTVMQANTQEDIIEGFLGIQPLRLLRADRFDTRFGITVPTGSWDTTDATIQIKPNRVDRGVITITRGRDGKKLIFYGDLFIVPSQVVGPNRVILEFRNALFRVRVDIQDQSGQMSSSINLTTTNQLDRILETAAVWRDFYTLMAWTVSEPMEFELRPRRKKIQPISGTSTPSENPDQAKQMERYASGADAVDWVMLRAEASGTKLRAKDLFDAADDLDVIKAIEQTPADVTALSFTTPYTEGLPEDFEYDMLYLNRVPIGSHEIAYAARTKVKSSRTGETMIWTSGLLQIAYVRKIKAGSDAFAQFAEKARRITGISNWFAPSETKLIQIPEKIDE